MKTIKKRMTQPWGVLVLLGLMILVLHAFMPSPRAAWCPNCGMVSVMADGKVWRSPSYSSYPACSTWTNPVTPAKIFACDGPMTVRADADSSRCEDDDPSYGFTTSVVGKGLKVETITNYNGYGSGFVELLVTVIDPNKYGMVTVTATTIASGYDDEDPSECGEVGLSVSGSVEYIPESGCGSSFSDSCTDSGSFGSGATDNNSVDFHLNLGQDSVLDSAGFLWLNADAPSTNLARPISLQYPFQRPNVEVITNQNGVIQQIRAPQGLVNVATNGYYEYSLQCFYDADVGSKVNGLYQTNAPAFVTWVVRNPDSGSASNRLSIKEQRDGIEREFLYTYTTQDYRWDLLMPDGHTLSTWKIAATGSNTNYYRQITVGGQVITKSQKTYQYISATNELLLLQEIEGDSTVTRTTTYTYYTSGGGSNKVQRIDYPDGNWVYYKYDGMGRVTNEFSAFLNYDPPTLGNEPNLAVNPFKLTEYAYSLNVTDDGLDDDGSARIWTPSKTVVKVPVLAGSNWELHEVSRTYNLSVPFSPIGEPISSEKIQQCVTPGAFVNDANNLNTVTYRYVTNNYLAGLPYSVTQPNGTTTTYDYPNQFTTIESKQDGTEMTTIVDGFGNILARTNKDTVVSVILSKDIYIYTNAAGAYLDPLRRSYDMIDLAGRTNRYRINGCCGFDYTVNPDGQTNRFDYDVLKRKVASTMFYGGITGIKTTNILDAPGRVLETRRIGTDGNTISQNQFLYDVLGRLMRETNALGGVTTSTNRIISNRLCVTNTYPDGGIRIETHYRDGRLESVTGTAVNPVRYEYGVEDVDASGGELWREFTKEIKLDASGADTGEWTKTYLDGLGQAYRTVYADAAYAESYYNNYGQLWKQRDPDGVWTLHKFNSNSGEREYTVVPVQGISGYEALSYAGFDPADNFSTADRVTLIVRTNVAAAGGKPDLVKAQTFVWDDEQSTGTAVLTNENSTTGLKSWHSVLGQDQSTYTETVYGTSGSRTVTTTQPDGSQIVQAYSYGRLSSITRKNSSGGQLERSDFQYDSHGRQYRMIDARNGTTEYAFNNADQVTSATTPSPGNFLPSQVTTTTYDNSGRAIRITQPDSTSVTNEYFSTGLLKWNYGSRTYPVLYAYDAQGRMTSMKTYTNFSGNPNSPGNAAETTWTYSSSRGWLTKKVYDGESDSTDDYTYTPGARLKTRVWERSSITTTYKYGFDDTTDDNQHGDLTVVDYSDSTPDVTQAYDRRGRLKTVACNSITTSNTYNEANLLLSATNFGAGSLNGLSVERTYYSSANTHALKLEKVRAKSDSTTQVEAYYGYDTGGRMSQVRDNLDTSYTADYGYIANSPLFGSVTFKQSSATRLSRTNDYDYLNRLRSISSIANGEALPLSYAYTYNSANQRIRMTLNDGSYWVYEYDKLGQVKSGKRYWREGTPVAGQQYDYGHDTIGNRTSTGVGGDENGGNLRSASYSANTKNQYTSRDVPPYIEVLGIAKVDSTVTVEGSSSGVYRRGEYFRKELNVDNSSAAQYPTIDVDTDVTSPVSGEKFLPKNQESFSHDLDGNLMQDGRWDYVWDAENRLLKLRSRTGSPAPERRLEFEYDWQGRRIRQTVWNDRDDGQGTEVSDTLYLYDGWNLITELNANASNAKVRTYILGLDLSGSMQGAGGVGGLLMVIDHTSTTRRHYSAYDGNGNVTALVDSTTGDWSARYEYGPFGEPIRANGDLAYANPIRWSTKYTDNESGLVYYGYRYYNPSTSRWLNRDPIGEHGGLNLYANSENDLFNSYDSLGLWPGRKKCTPGTVISMGPWSMIRVFPSADFYHSQGGGLSAGVSIVYKHQVRQVFVCCRCTITNTVPYYTVVNADSDRSEILWKTGPAGPWPPLDLIAVAIEAINEGLYTPTPADIHNQTIVNALVRENTPAATVLGTLRPEDIPKRWCWW